MKERDVCTPNVLILLLSAVLLVAIFRRLGQPVILAYLFVGMLLGPHGAAIVTGQAMMQTIGELGIVFLMFSLGLEFFAAAPARHAQAGAGGSAACRCCSPHCCSSGSAGGGV